MMEEINRLIKEGDKPSVLSACCNPEHSYIGLLFAIVWKHEISDSYLNARSKLFEFLKTNPETVPLLNFHFSEDEIEMVAFPSKTFSVKWEDSSMSDFWKDSIQPRIWEGLELTRNETADQSITIKGGMDLSNINDMEICKKFIETQFSEDPIMIGNINQICSAINQVLKNYHSQKITVQKRPKSDSEILRVLLLANWINSKELCHLWNKMSAKGNFTWGNIKIVWSEPADYYVVINKPPAGFSPPPEKTLVFQMEPHMQSRENMWGEWSNPDPKKYLYVGVHSVCHNTCEWHLSKSYEQLSSEIVVKNENLEGIISTVLSVKYSDPGHVKRIDFAKFLDEKGFPLHVFGDNKFDWKNYHGSLPYHQKDNAMFPYKYTFNVENHSIDNYFTEKLIDGILAETVVFYHGPENIREYIDPACFVWLDLSNFEVDYLKIKSAIENDFWSERIDIIRAEKKRILNDMQFFPRLEKIICSTIKPTV